MKAWIARSSLPAWVVIWLLLSLPLIFWDIGFVLLRPHSMPGGDLAFLWAPYKKYITVDLGYADVNNGFVWAQAMVTFFEAAAAIWGLVLSFGPKQRLAFLLVFSASLLTFAKTSLIFLIEIVTGGEHVGHNPLPDLILLYVLPNALWVVFPAAVSWVCGRRLVRG